MFRGLRKRRGDGPAVGPEWERGAPATRWVGASSEKNQEQKISRESRGEPQCDRHSMKGTEQAAGSRATRWSGLDF